MNEEGGRQALGAASSFAGGEHPRTQPDNRRREREAGENQQWRRGLKGLDDWRVGLGGRRAPSQWREEEAALLAAL